MANRLFTGAKTWTARHGLLNKDRLFCDPLVMTF
jgi:hypothetical protein